MLQELTSVRDQRGTLSVIEHENGIDFPVRRLYMVHDMCGDRGEHAHLKTNQIIICTNGSIMLSIQAKNDAKKEYILEPYENSVRIYPLSWIQVKPLTKGASYLVIADTVYDDSDTIRNYQQYLELCRN